MNLNIEGQIPIISKVYRDNQLYVPINIQRALNWNVGDKIEIYPTVNGVFFKKGENK